MSRNDTRRGQLPRRLAVLFGARPQFSPRARRWLLLLAAVLFLVGGVLAWKRLPVGAHLVHWKPLALLAAVPVPATVVLNAARFQISARILGRHVSSATALRVSVAATAANLLPLPGAALVRIQGLKVLGEGYGAASAATGVVAGAWAGVTLTAAGLWQLPAGSPLLSGVLAAVGITALAAAALGLRALVPEGRFASLASRLLVLEGLVLLTAAGRLYLVFSSLGVDVRFHQTIALTVAGVAASAVGVLPGGLGLREAAAAGLASLLALPASAGYLAAAIDRLVGLIVLFLITAVLALSGTTASKP